MVEGFGGGELFPSRQPGSREIKGGVKKGDTPFQVLPTVAPSSDLALPFNNKPVVMPHNPSTLQTQQALGAILDLNHRTVKTVLCLRVMSQGP